jgi:hypothetical protein
VPAGPASRLAQPGTWSSSKAPVQAIPLGADSGLEEAHAQATGFDPRTLAEEYVYLRITPDSIQAWREANELAGRQLMRRGEWLD